MTKLITLIAAVNVPTTILLEAGPALKALVSKAASFGIKSSPGLVELQDDHVTVLSRGLISTFEFTDGGWELESCEPA